MAEQPKYVTTADGRKITYDRWKYEQTLQQEAVLKRVNTLLNDDAANAVSVGVSMSQQEYGGLLRAVVPNLLDKWGKVNATAAIQFYDEAQMQWLKTYSQASTKAARSNAKRQASRNALARTQGALAVAQGYSAQFADTYDLVGKTDTVVNFAMKVRAKSGHAPSVAAMNNALTREVAAYHRDTILFNSALDPNVNRVQRVAQASACEFCRLMALGSTNGRVRTSTYAVKFHSHCHCTIQPLFDGEEPIRPDYYDEFEQEYAEVYKGNSAKDTLAEWRGLRERKAAAATPIAVAKKVDLANGQEVKSVLSFQRAQGFTAETVPLAQKQALEDYVSTNPKILGHRDVNGVLRGDLGSTYTFSQENPAQVVEIRDKVAALDNLIQSAPALKEPVLTYRGINNRFAYSFRKLEPGQSFQDLGFTSTSLTDEVAKTFARRGLIIEVENPAGTKGIAVDAFTNDITDEWVDTNIVDTVRYGFHHPKVEMEWLLPRNTTFEVIEAEKDGVIRVRVKQ